MRSPTDSLTTLLRRADPAAGARAVDPAAFAAAVHARIHSADTAPLSAVRSLGRNLLPLAAALALLASIGAGSSIAIARERSVQAETYAAAYARSIDPWQMHGPAAAASATAAPVHDHGAN